MKLRTIRDTLDALVIEGEGHLDVDVEHIYASDLMSDVLAFGKANSLLLTGLATQQALISAHMAEFRGVVLVRGKRPRDGSAEFARNSHLVLMSTTLDMYDTCVRIDSLEPGHDHHAVTHSKTAAAEDTILNREFFVAGNDFVNAGMVSTEVKSVLRTIGFDPALIRRVAICTFEGEMNVVMHARSGRVNLAVTPKVIEVRIDDEGKGIPDVQQAMQEGFTTATEEMRAKGFGSGMGLSNMKKNASEFEVVSEVGKGTTVRMTFQITDA